MIDGGVGRRCRRGRAPGIDDRRATLGHGWDELIGHPRLVHRVSCRPGPDGGVAEVGVLGAGVVAPDRDLGDVGDRRGGLRRQLGHGPIVVEPGHGGETAGVHAGSGRLGDQRVGVGGVAHDEHLDVRLGRPADGVALGAEDATVGRQQVAALHARLAGHGTHQQGDVGITEGDVGIVGLDHLGQQRKRTILQLHGHALERSERRGDFQHLQRHRLICTQHGA